MNSAGVPGYVSATNYSNNTGYPLPPAPPPAYHEDAGNLPGQTYYQPPAPPVSYPPPSLEQEPPHHVNPVAQFYSPPDNRKLALRRRVSSCLCCIVIIIIIVGLAAGLSQSSSYNHRYCECRTNADCVSLYGPRVYCYQSCDCGTI
ncbi:uncharacterized protein ATC70_006351 [Mucor velutinosus]|uniref:Uncharacterized protein n=1 Tax=Mucor velutinosus TaxID=708070 RepID=A0AAN7D5G5_9FUNG|nr:hypothetical protein ATC70_006351 [Mucor velutinosus]